METDSQWPTVTLSKFCIPAVLGVPKWSSWVEVGKQLCRIFQVHLMTLESNQAKST